MTSIIGPRDRAVYKWQSEVVYPHDLRLVNPEMAKSIVSYVWSEEGLRGPPRLTAVPNMRGATGTRLEIRIPSSGVRSTTLLHELAHSMDVSLESSMAMYEDRPEGETMTGSVHDANWLGIYLNLLDKFVGGSLNKLYLMGTLKSAGLDFKMVPVIRCR